MQARPQPPGSGKILYVETLRGIACILLVSYHVIGNTSANGLQLPADNIYSVLNQLLVDLRMPLFSFISGFVFNSFARDGDMLRGKILGKTRRLLLPMIVVGSLHYWSQATFAPQSSEQVQFLEIFFLPYEHFWYLQATFILMLVVYLVTYLLHGDGVKAALLLIGPALLASILLSRWTPDIFSSYKALYLAPYFLVGYLIASAAPARAMMEAGSRNKVVLVAAVVALAVLFGFEYLVQQDELALTASARRAFGTVVGLTACLSFFLYRFRSTWLAFIGDKSYAIFLFHVFFTAGSRIVLTSIFPNISIDLLFPIGLAAGVIGPICVAWLAQKSALAALLLLGIRTAPKPRTRRDNRQIAHHEV